MSLSDDMKTFAHLGHPGQQPKRFSDLDPAKQKQILTEMQQKPISVDLPCPGGNEELPDQ